MSEFDKFREILPEETLEIATAIADRSAKSDQFIEKIIAELQDEPYVENPSEVQRNVHMGRTVLLMLQVEDPTRPFALRELTDASLANGGYEYLATKMNEKNAEIDSDIEINPDGYKEFLSSFIGEIQESSELLSDDKFSKNFEKQLIAAREVAELHGTDVATVYRTDSLYFEASSRAFTLNESANSYTDMVNSFSLELFQKMVMNMVEKMIPAEMADFITEEDKAEIAEDLRSNSEVQVMLSAQTDIAKEAVRQTALHNIVKSYGIEALSDLSAKQREAILPKMPLAAHVREAVKFS